MYSIILASLVVAAPAPTRKPPPPKPPAATPAHVGGWRMHWGQGQGDAVFHKDGGYWCLWAGQQWIGYWQLDGRRLIITEGKMPDRPDSVPDSPVRWVVELDGDLTQGDVIHEGRRFSFRLSRTP